MTKSFDKNLGYIGGWVSILLNTTLFVAKYWVGTQLGSISMIADAWHSLSDTLASLVMIIGFWVSAQPADSRHPFGHGRAEAIAALIIGCILALVGFEFIRESIGRLQHRQAAQFGLLCIVVFSASMVLKEALTQAFFWAAKRINSKSMVADGWHHRSDAIASGLIVLAALFGARFWWIDGVMGLVVAGFILYATYGILRDAAGYLLGQDVSPELEDRVQTIITRVAPFSSDIHHLHFHTYGSHMEVTLHMRLPSAMNVGEAHRIAQIIEDAIRNETHIETTVHIDPAEEPDKD